MTGRKIVKNLKVGMRVKFSYFEVERYRHWRVSGTGKIVKINYRRPCPIQIERQGYINDTLVRQCEILRIIKSN